MTAPTKLNFKLYQGSTFEEVIRWESASKIYKPITGITQAAPCVVTCVAHGMPLGWRFKITNVGGMKDLNSSTDYYTTSATTTDSLTLDGVNAVGFAAYTSGGIIEYNQPVDMAGMTARMQIREKLTSDTTLDTLTTENGKLAIDNTKKTISIILDATTTAAYTFTSAVYSLEIVAGSQVAQLAYGSITLVKEITR